MFQKKKHISTLNTTRAHMTGNKNLYFVNCSSKVLLAIYCSIIWKILDLVFNLFFTLL
jgi:hypothetical protein